MLFDAGLTAWATLVLAALVLVAAVYARRAWQAQAAQVQMLSEQLAADQALVREQLPVLEGQRRELEASRRLREREEEERREAGQAESWICARNVGDVPVYEVGFAWSVGGELASFDTLGRPFLPGPDEVARSWPPPPGISPEDVAIALFIRDANWNRWRIQADGRRQPFTGDMLPPGTW
jgi:hypothetical protein